MGKLPGPLDNIKKIASVGTDLPQCRGKDGSRLAKGKKMSMISRNFCNNLDFF